MRRLQTMITAGCINMGLAVTLNLGVLCDVIIDLALLGKLPWMFFAPSSFRRSLE